jgi:hypothetical protein
MSQTNRDNSRGWQTTNTGGTNYVGEIHFHGNEPKSPLTRQEYRNRQALLTKVNNFWVKGVLEKSLYNQVMIELGLEERPDAITNRRKYRVRVTGRNLVKLFICQPHFCPFSIRNTNHSLCLIRLLFGKVHWKWVCKQEGLSHVPDHSPTSVFGKVFFPPSS